MCVVIVCDSKYRSLNSSQIVEQYTNNGSKIAVGVSIFTNANRTSRNRKIRAAQRISLTFVGKWSRRDTLYQDFVIKKDIIFRNGLKRALNKREWKKRRRWEESYLQFQTNYGTSCALARDRDKGNRKHPNAILYVGNVSVEHYGKTVLSLSLSLSLERGLFRNIYTQRNNSSCPFQRFRILENVRGLRDVERRKWPAGTRYSGSRMLRNRSSSPRKGWENRSSSLHPFPLSPRRALRFLKLYFRSRDEYSSMNKYSENVSYYYIPRTFTYCFLIIFLLRISKLTCSTNHKYVATHCRETTN